MYAGLNVIECRLVLGEQATGSGGTRRSSGRYLGHGAAQDVLVLLLGDVLLVVVRLQHQLHLLHHALLTVQFFQKLEPRRQISW